VRENNRLGFEWDVLKYENEELDLPDYVRRIKKRKLQIRDKSPWVKYLWSHERLFKQIVSFAILIFMV
jgi:hypothetical protein